MWEVQGGLPWGPQMGRQLVKSDCERNQWGEVRVWPPRLPAPLWWLILRLAVPRKAPEAGKWQLSP